MISRRCFISVNTHLDNVLDLVLADGSITVNVVQIKSPLEFVHSFARGGEVQCDDVFLKIQRAVCVEVKTAKNMPCVLGGIGIGKEAGIDAFKLLLGNAPTWTFFKEGGVPGRQPVLCVCGVRL